jgi:hypothetical protein
MSGQEIAERTGRTLLRAQDWSVEVTFDLRPPAPEGYWQDVEALAREIGVMHVVSMLVGRQRWVAWRPSQPRPFIEMMVDRDGQTLSLDVRELPAGELTRHEWDALYDGIRLLNVAAQQKAGRPKGSRNDLDHQTWLAKTRELRRLVRHENVSMPGAIARLELHTSPTTGWKWIEDLDQDEPEGPANSSS